MERIYTIPLRSSFRNVARYRKTNKAVSACRAFLEKHMKSKDVRLGQHLNLFLWAKGIKNPPPRVTVKAVKDDEGVVRAELEGKDYKGTVKAEAKAEEGNSLTERLASKMGAKPAASAASPAPQKDSAQ